ncbi:MAG: Inositol-1-monophosphatase [Owenweeksia sp. TMED14]|nr:MAG: Inositol-1-monophosphatase [Owenweeksia sp. TMED14]|tara:strand:- start:866 stop:1675 length:810 start_codon:yes stop_codon:yes gene_type:complete
MKGAEIKKALKLIFDVGRWIKDQQLKLLSDTIKTKSLNSFVSYVDIEAEKKLISGLQEIIPKSGLIAEESRVSELSGGYNWVIDPLDGTTNYIHNINPCAISVALMLNEEIIWSAILDLSSFKMYSAEKGNGAFCDEVRLDIKRGSKISEGLVGTGFPYYDFSQVDPYLNVLKECFKKSRGVRRFGSAAIDLCLVAEGRFVAFFEYGLAPWDVAAGLLIVRESGGFVDTFHSMQFSDRDILFARNIVAGNPESFSNLSSWTSKYFKKIQ